ncbi:hypothetical protein GF358_02220 [Candidatus Woesearchaeota archaeon]|nr:hypothetical protein [Candidatus Woesearchaeota archaeon]
MLLELVIILSIANIVFTVLIMKQCCSTSPLIRKKAKKRIAEEEEEYAEPTALTQKQEKKSEYKPLKIDKLSEIKEKLHIKKKNKNKKHVSETPDMNRVIEELQSEFKKGNTQEKKTKKSKNEIADRLKEIEEA